MKIPKYCNFTQPEVDYYIATCNFTPRELEYFKRRTQDETNIQISFAMNLSEYQVNYTAKKVKKKILKRVEKCLDYLQTH